MTLTKKNYNNPVAATVTGILDLFRKQVPAGVLKATDRLEGKQVLVDGSSSGLGYAVAMDCARRGARVIMACRSGIPEKGETIRRMTGNPNVSMVPVDFADIRSINHLTETLKNDFPPSDIIICNAGIVPKKSRQTPQGLEEMFMVNYFSKFIFINELLEKGCLNQTAGIPRILFVASESHRNPESFNWDSFGLYREYTIGKSIELYGYYKLLLTTFAAELSRKLNPDGSVHYSVFALCPGPINSNIGREAPAVFQPLLKLVFGLFFRSPEKAAVPVMYLAASPDMEGKPFDYLFLMNRRLIDEKAADPANGKRLWNLSEELLQRLQS
ncbi:MAG TPA: SDR family NAD(P)-dependent oxidoreductase [Bacteroidales bacterium]|jgi:NAD(P)-dependent dehydrogenase (short-subunit alcohol dehydrogenase family)|nr:SDR family NAD(P)-dependent oxidoreductase [Bacteroidales bacterium]HPT09909.1 SDR family NAD(P)-dependent oxidoreductase [Bacteroidales bacterium]